MTPRITELHVRLDCNGCEHKIRKTLSAIDGVSEVYMDQANHKIKVVGIADLKRIVKAIRKTKRVPTICSHTDPSAETQPPPPPAEGEASPPTDPPADAPPPAEATPENKEAPPAEPTPENKEAPPATEATVIHTVHVNPYGHDDRLFQEHWANHPIDMYGLRYDAAPYHVTHSHSYSHHRASPYFAEYGYGSFPVQEGRYYSHDYYLAARGKGDSSQITSMFSDENPNACSIS
ncbi:hypothetical protein QOZ80_1AG0014400 [Eleusine coracana subsp. coracana]|nr:hypothetical protein QOZ80_1AG0014400 [Eleusine coracana subsp. coracana]